jgi:hypothetical protein
LPDGLASLESAFAQAAQEPPKHADFLFVQTAKGMTLDKASGKLTLDGVSPVTAMFSDRPERIAANMNTAAFVPFWSKGKDSFLSDLPNADISLVEGSQLRQIVAVLQDPVPRGDNLSYSVKVLEGENAGQGSRRLGVHRHRRHADDTALLCGCRAAQLSASVLPLTFSKFPASAGAGRTKP